ncbi:MAG: hypothetical protein ACYTXF_26180 [Nostoc sp.]
MNNRANQRHEEHHVIEYFCIFNRIFIFVAEILMSRSLVAEEVMLRLVPKFINVPDFPG